MEIRQDSQGIQGVATLLPFTSIMAIISISLTHRYSQDMHRNQSSSSVPRSELSRKSGLMMTAKGGRVSQLCLWSSEKTSREYGAGTAHMGSWAQSHQFVSSARAVGAWPLGDFTAFYSLLDLAKLPWCGTGLLDGFLPISLFSCSHHNTFFHHQLSLRKAWCLLLQTRKQLGQWLHRGEGRIGPKC